MKRIILFVLLIVSGINSFSQKDSVLKFIFVPHPRTENKVKQSVLSGIEKIDFSKFDMILLGGDLTYSTSKDRIALAYCDSLFNLGSPNTLWSFGNHDVQSGNRSLIKEYTGRESYYSYYRDNITFLVLDTELNANGFSSTFISGNQLQMIKNVCDTISKSGYLIILHSRFMWMINNNYFITKLDSVAASSKSLDTTNFYPDIYPLIKKVKTKGIQVICLGGDKSEINVKYSPEDSITFYAATMAPEMSDNVNNVLILNYSLKNKTITSEYITLAKIDKNNQSTALTLSVSKNNVSVYPNPVTGWFKVIGIEDKARLTISDINGRELFTKEITDNEQISLNFLPQGMYIIKIATVSGTLVKKILK